MSAIATAVVGSAVIGGVIQAEGQKSASRSASTAAKDAAAVEERGFKEAMGIQEKSLSEIQGRVAGREDAFGRILAQTNDPMALRSLTTAIDRQQQNINRQMELYRSLDPAVLEASQQALSLLRGEEARSLKPIQEERQRQRQDLVDRLREQMGPGAETSTAGIQALNQFDRQTNMMTAQVQQQSMGQLFGMAQSGAAGRSNLNQGNIALANMGAQNAQIGLGALAGMTSGDQMIQQGYSNVANARIGQGGAAAGQYAAGAIEAQGQAQAAATYGNTIAQAGGMLGGFFAGGGGGGSFNRTNAAGDQSFGTWDF